MRRMVRLGTVTAVWRLTTAMSNVPADIAVAYEHPLIADAAQARPIVVSPDGGRIIYSLLASSNPMEAQVGLFLTNGSPSTSEGIKLWLLDRRTKGSRQICPGEGATWDAAFSPDGGSAAFYSDRGGKVRLWLWNATSNQCRVVSDLRIKSLPFPNAQPRWAPDGRTIFVSLWPERGPGSYAAGTAALTMGKPPAASAGEPLVLRTGTEQPAKTEKPVDRLEDRCGPSAYMAATIAGVDVASGSVRPIVSDKDSADVAQGKTRHHPSPWFDVSPSGRWISYHSTACRKQGQQFEMSVELYVVPAAGGTPIRLASGLRAAVGGAEFDFGSRWHPERDELAFLDDGALYTADLRQERPGNSRRLGQGLAHLAPNLLRYSVDGSSLYVGEDEAHWRDLDYRRAAQPVLVQVPVNGGRFRRLPPVGSLTITDIVTDGKGRVWSDGAELLTSAIDRVTGDTALLAFNFQSGVVRTAWEGAASLSGTVASDRGLLSVFQDFATPPDIYAITIDGRERTRLTHVAPGLDILHPGSMRTFGTRVALADGTLREVQSTLLLPPGSKAERPMPTVVWFYPGGDINRYARRYGAPAMTDIAHLLTARGIAVLLTDIPLGPGNERGHVVDEIADALLPQVYHGIDLGLIDPNRVALRGQSFGGFATVAMIARTSMFRAAIASSGVYDLGGAYGDPVFREGQLSDKSLWMETSQPRLGQPVWDDPLRYIENSPYYSADRIHTPLLILQGTNDPVGFNEGPKMFAALRRLGRKVELALYEGAGHQPGAWRTDQARDQMVRTINFLGEQFTPH